MEQAKNLTDKKEKKLNLKSRAADLFGRYSMVIILAGLLIAFQLMTDGIFWRPLNITNLVLQNSHILVLAAGMLLVVLLGHVDLSVGSVMAFVGAIAGMMMVNRQMNPWMTVDSYRMSCSRRADRRMARFLGSLCRDTGVYRDFSRIADVSWTDTSCSRRPISSTFSSCFPKNVYGLFTRLKRRKQPSLLDIDFRNDHHDRVSCWSMANKKSSEKSFI